MFGWKPKNAAITARSAEFSGAMDGLLITGQSGFVGGTHLASNLGWRAVETLSVGDKVLTFDRGMQTVFDIQRETLFAADHVFWSGKCPVLVPEGAMNNRKDLWLMPDQGMLVETDVASDAMGDPFTVVPARALKGLRGIRTAPSVDHLNVTTLAFASDEVVYVEGGLLAYCPRPRSILTEGPAAGAQLYTVLDLRAARYLVECLIDDDDGAALICDPDELIGVARQSQRTERPSRLLT